MLQSVEDLLATPTEGWAFAETDIADIKSSISRLDAAVARIDETLARMDERLSHMASKAWVLRALVGLLIAILCGSFALAGWMLQRFLDPLVKAIGG
ncbi:hypothetical protein [Pinirhizobacter soli]|uniref:hypothetical protein n=1 Tax=Pinirhizobacter soli TaxID=2786953 RepID=UPI00202A9473|nr:hypothetical protein [Pinirhizobacter soli]